MGISKKIRDDEITNPKEQMHTHENRSILVCNKTSDVYMSSKN